MPHREQPARRWNHAFSHGFPMNPESVTPFTQQSPQRTYEELLSRAHQGMLISFVFPTFLMIFGKLYGNSWKLYGR